MMILTTPTLPVASRRVSRILQPLLAILLLARMSPCAHGDIFRWDNHAVIPGTEGLVPGPGIQLDNRDLAFADFLQVDLLGSSFQQSNLSAAAFHQATLFGANLAGANILGASFTDTTARGFTKDQFYSTASYQQQNLVGIGMASNDLSAWDFHAQNLTGAFFANANLAGASLAGANLTDSTLWLAQLANATLNDATVVGASFEDTTAHGLTKEQFYSTASYQGHQLQRVRLASNDLRGWNLAGQDLTQASLSGSDLTDASLASANLSQAKLWLSTLTGTSFKDAIVQGASLEETTAHGFTFEQLASTQSYIQHDLRNIELSSNEMPRWNFEAQNLSDASFGGSNLSGASFAGANLKGAKLWLANLSHTDFQGATVIEASLNDTTSRGFTNEQLYSTKSYQANDLHGIGLASNDMSGWNFAGKNLQGSFFASSILKQTNFHGADLRGATFWLAEIEGADFSDAIIANANFEDATNHGLTAAQIYSTSSYQQRDLHGLNLLSNNLSGWNLSQQDLHGANLGGANLAQTDLSGANLMHSQLWLAPMPDTNLTGADLRGAIGADLTGARTQNTILPNGTIDGLDLPNGAILIVRNDLGDTRACCAQAPLPVTVAQRFDLHGGTLALQFDANNWNSTVKFVADTPVSLQGVLDLAFASGVDVNAQIGRTMHVFDWAGVTPTGQFSISSPWSWDISQLYTLGNITLKGVAVVGDLNQDGTVDAADAGVMFANWSGSGVGDLNGDGIVDAADAGQLFEHWTGDSAPQAVPEPSGGTLMLATVAIARFVRRRKRSLASC